MTVPRSGDSGPMGRVPPEHLASEAAPRGSVTYTGALAQCFQAGPADRAQGVALLSRSVALRASP